jgi:hypothetical protein
VSDPFVRMADEWDREEASIAPKQESHGFDANRFDRMVEKAAAKSARTSGNGGAAAVDDSTKPIPSQKSLTAFPLLAFKDIRLDLTRRNYLVKGLLPRSGLAVIWGPPKCYKSFWTMDIALFIARGVEYRGLRVQQAPIVYVMLEGREGLGTRKEALARHYGVEDAPLYFITSTLDLAKQAPALVSAIEAQLGDIKPGAIFVDTLNRSLVGSESKDEDMTAYLAGAGFLEQKFGCLVAIVHHCGIDASRPRGHTSLTGAVEVQLRVERVADLQVLVTVEAAKDIPEGTEIASRLEIMDLGPDEDGDPTTSLIVVPLDPDAPKPVSRFGNSKPEKLTKGQRCIQDAINEALGYGANNIIPRAGMMPVNAVTVTDVKREFDRLYPASDPETAGDAKRKAFGRAMEWLPSDQYGTGALNGSDWIWRIK